MVKLSETEKYVAYLDILGFRDMLRDDSFMKRVSDIVKVLEQRTEFDESHHPYLSYLAISDTIIICAPEGHAPNLFWKISQVQNAMLNSGFCVRGGIAFGSVLIYGERPMRNIFGTTLVTAYSIEVERAIYPRVVIENAVVEKIRAEFFAQKKQSEPTFLLRDVDGCIFVNQFGRDVGDATSGNEHRKRKALKNRNLYRQRIEEGLDAADIKGKMKWSWLDQQLRSQFDQFL